MSSVDTAVIQAVDKKFAEALIVASQRGLKFPVLIQVRDAGGKLVVDATVAAEDANTSEVRVLAIEAALPLFGRVADANGLQLRL